MLYMKQLPSSSFRKVYAALTEPTEVTVLGRPIGVWLSGQRAAQLVERLSTVDANAYREGGEDTIADLIDELKGRP